MITRWSALALLLALAGAIALRVPQLDARPLHNDEGVNAVKVAELWQHGRYVYDPDEYHGPTLHYATLLSLWLGQARTAAEVTDAQLRYATIAFGVALILLLPLFADGIGRAAVAWAALFVAISPAMVFYSRYFIHEMLLVFFTALALGAGWRYLRTRRLRWAVFSGSGLGLMWATKETFVLSVAAAALAALVTARWTLGPGQLIEAVRARWKGRHVALALLATLLMWLLFFSSFFTNFHGLVDSVVTYFPWLKRAGGHSPHIHPWYFYLERLAWFHPKKSPVWSEALVLVLALAGLISACLRGAPLPRFIAIYTVVLTAIYSVISYKTPWCLLNFYLGIILLAGIGASALVDLCRGRVLKVALAGVILGASAQLAWQTWQVNTVYAADRRNPYVYAQTGPSLRDLVQRVEAIAQLAPSRFDTVVKSMAPGSDYWPLPWYLRRFQRLGFYDDVPADPYAPIVIANSKLDARLDEKSDRKWIMAGITEFRPGVFLELYVELELWKRFVETLPRDRDE